MNIIQLFVLICSCLIICVEAEFITLTFAAIAAGAGYAGYTNYFYCLRNECCTDGWITRDDTSKLDYKLDQHLFGQHIAHETILSALRGYSRAKSHKKALTLSFHGTPGTGKNYVSQMIAEAYFQKGTQSKYYHFFNGRSEFPKEDKVHEYQRELNDKITKSLAECSASMFVFDEVDKMPKGVLDAIVPFIDYTDAHGSNNSIFIFLSNTGSKKISDRFIELWESGKTREETKLQDYEHLTMVGAFNEIGGFSESDTIKNNLIDHYVPFLPLEESHILKCIETEFREMLYKPKPEEIQEVLSYVTFGPEPYKIVAETGCKRIYPKVKLIVNREWIKNKDET